jgi:hypothetical protein
MEDHHHKREMREHELTESIERLQISIEENRNLSTIDDYY